MGRYRRFKFGLPFTKENRVVPFLRLGRVSCFFIRACTRAGREDRSVPPSFRHVSGVLEHCYTAPLSCAPSWCAPMMAAPIGQSGIGPVQSGIDPVRIAGCVDALRSSAVSVQHRAGSQLVQSGIGPVRIAGCVDALLFFSDGPGQPPQAVDLCSGGTTGSSANGLQTALQTWFRAGWSLVCNWLDCVC